MLTTFIFIFSKSIPIAERRLLVADCFFHKKAAIAGRRG
jgi:hypothetical protein